MPRTKLYTTDAERQQAYRLRRLSAGASASRTVIGNPWPRWRRLAGDAASVLGALLAEMTEYQQTRSDRWQESDKADDFEDRLAALAEAHEQVCDWIKDA